MRIRQRLQLNVAVSVIIAIVIGTMLLLSLQRITTVSNLTKTAGDIMSGMLERVTLGNDYIRNNNTRAKEQWFAKHEQIGRLLTSAAEKFQAPGDRDIIAGMVETHQSIGRIFSAIVANKEKRELAGIEREGEERLLSQLNMRVYEVTIQVHRLLESSRKALSSVLRQTGVTIGSILALLIAAAIYNSWSMDRALTERVRRLREGAVLIGGGDLGHRIDISGDDELTELSVAFNAMAGKLRDSYQSLENEVKERRLTEENLRQTAAELTDSRRAAINLMEDAHAAHRQAEKAAAELSEGNKELTFLNRAMVGRELRMVELKGEVNALCEKAGEPPRYSQDDGEGQS